MDGDSTPRLMLPSCHFVAWRFFCAAAGALGISLGDNREEIHIIPASCDVEETPALSGTRVYMKSGRALRSLKQALVKQSEEKPLEVFCVENCGMEHERKMYGRSEIDDAAGYLTILIVKEGK